MSIPQTEIYSWQSQVRQYDEFGMPGVSYYKGVISRHIWADCLLWRDEHGLVIGILNHYPVANALETKGNVNVFIHPDHKRQGIGTLLVQECIRRWGPINLDQQRFTPEGAAFAQRLESEIRSKNT